MSRSMISENRDFFRRIFQPSISIKSKPIQSNYAESDDLFEYRKFIAYYHLDIVNRSYELLQFSAEQWG